MANEAVVKTSDTKQKNKNKTGKRKNTKRKKHITKTENRNGFTRKKEKIRYVEGKEGEERRDYDSNLTEF